MVEKWKRASAAGGTALAASGWALTQMDASYPPWVVIGALVAGAFGLCYSGVLYYRAAQDWLVARHAARPLVATPLNVVAPTPNLRMPLIELVSEAKRRGLDTTDSRFLEFFRRMRQAALDGDMTFFGRPKHRAGFDELTRIEPLHMIPTDHWREFEIAPMSVLTGDKRESVVESDNSQTYSYVMGDVGKSGGFADIHVERAQAMRWVDGAIGRS